MATHMIHDTHMKYKIDNKRNRQRQQRKYTCLESTNPEYRKKISTIIPFVERLLSKKDVSKKFLQSDIFPAGSLARCSLLVTQCR